MGKSTLDAKQILKDIRAGMDDQGLMDKYRLSPKGLAGVFAKLVKAGVLDQPGIDRRRKPRPKAVAVTGQMEIIVDGSGGFEEPPLTPTKPGKGRTPAENRGQGPAAPATQFFSVNGEVEVVAEGQEKTGRVHGRSGIKGRAGEPKKDVVIAARIAHPASTVAITGDIEIVAESPEPTIRLSHGQSDMIAELGSSGPEAPRKIRVIGPTGTSFRHGAVSVTGDMEIEAEGREPTIRVFGKGGDLGARFIPETGKRDPSEGSMLGPADHGAVAVTRDMEVVLEGEETVRVHGRAPNREKARHSPEGARNPKHVAVTKDLMVMAEGAEEDGAAGEPGNLGDESGEPLAGGPNYQGNASVAASSGMDVLSEETREQTAVPSIEELRRQMEARPAKKHARKLKAADLEKDVRDGIDNPELMRKYALNEKTLLALLRKLAATESTESSDIEERISELESAVFRSQDGATPPGVAEAERGAGAVVDEDLELLGSFAGIPRSGAGSAAHEGDDGAEATTKRTGRRSLSPYDDAPVAVVVGDEEKRFKVRVAWYDRGWLLILLTVGPLFPLWFYFAFVNPKLQFDLETAPTDVWPIVASVLAMALGFVGLVISDDFSGVSKGITVGAWITVAVAGVLLRPHTPEMAESIVKELNAGGNYCHAEFTGWFKLTLNIWWTTGTDNDQKDRIMKRIRQSKDILKRDGVTRLKYPNNEGVFEIEDWETGAAMLSADKALIWFQGTEAGP
ncbi:MAG: hypothetical protein V2B18_18130 [Pseudomonadota bacterium]